VSQANFELVKSSSHFLLTSMPYLDKILLDLALIGTLSTMTFLSLSFQYDSHNSDIWSLRLLNHSIAWSNRDSLDNSHDSTSDSFGSSLITLTVSGSSHPTFVAQ